MDRSDSSRLARIQAKWKPIRAKKIRQNKNLEPRSDFIGTGKALKTLLLLVFTGFASEARVRYLVRHRPK
jgi:hypothetical protein